VESESGIDYLKLIEQFGCAYITPETNENLAKLVEGGGLHRFLRRNIFFCHRDLEKILTKYENKIPFYLYTGRGPSAEAMHLGHAVPMIFTVWL
jgi:tryptophanyl-tRNA synthetase